MLFGTGLAFFLGKPLHPAQGAESAGASTSAGGAASRRSAQALQVNYLFLIGIVLAFALAWALRRTRAGA